MMDFGPQLDAIFGNRVIVEVPPPKPYMQILNDAEGLPEGVSDNAAVRDVLRECIRAKLDDLDVSEVLKAIKKKTKREIGALKKLFQSMRKANGAATPIDIGVRICDETLERYYAKGARLVRSLDGQFWEFIATHWVRRTDEQVAARMLDIIKETVAPDEAGTSAVLSQGMAIIRATRAQQADVFRFTEEPLPIINCKNGELWLAPDRQYVLGPHTPASYLTYCLDFAYEPHAKAPLFDQTLLQIFAKAQDPEGMARHFMEFMGYAIQPLRDIPAWWMFKGHGANGKSKLIETVTRLVGPDAVASARVETIETPFGCSPLLGKLIMVDDDVDANTRLPDGALKRISERKRISIEFKGRTPFDAVLTVLPVMLCNNFPGTSDVTHGMLRRANVMPFGREFSEAEQDRALFDRIWATEMPGILNGALAGLARLRVRGRFDPPFDCRAAKAEWLSAANPLKAFMDECLERDTTGRCKQIKLTHLYAAMGEWASAAGVRHLTARKRVKSNLESMGYPLSTSGGLTTLPGYQFNPEGMAALRKAVDITELHEAGYQVSKAHGPVMMDFSPCATDAD